MTERKPKRPRDPNQLAKSIVDLATGESAALKSVESKEDAFYVASPE